MRQGLLEVGFPEDRIAPGVFDEDEAVKRALATAEPGDLLVIFGDKLDHDWSLITNFGKATGTGETPAEPVFRERAEPLARAILDPSPPPARAVPPPADEGGD